MISVKIVRFTNNLINSIKIKLLYSVFNTKTILKEKPITYKIGYNY